MGILNNKSRVLDTIITRAGKSNLALGGLDIKYVSFTDGTAFYFPQPSGTLDQVVLEDSIKFQLEASNLPQDQVVFGVNDQGNIESSTYSSLTGVTITDGEVNIVDNDSLISYSTTWTNRLVSSSMDNFRDLKLISTTDLLFDDDQFGTVPSNTSFTGSQFSIKNGLPLQHSSYSRQERSLPETFRDPLFGNRLNYKFLPPIRKLGSEPVDKSNYGSYKDYVLAQYSPWGLLGGEENQLTAEEILSEHEKFIDSNNYSEIKFDPTSRDNNLLIQGFEIEQTAPNDITVKRLDKLFFVDYGVHKLDPNDRVKEKLKLGDQVHIVFAGRLHKKSNSGNYAFIRLFTMFFG
jgi:hypothetical protein